MSIIEIYEAAFNRYIDLLESAHEITHMDRRCITEEHELEIRSADITAHLIAKACGPNAVSEDISF